MEPWEDRVFDRCASAVFWPFDCARGRSTMVRLIAVTLGWCWVLPAVLLIGMPMFVIIGPIGLWKELGDPHD